ncbi:MAG: isp 2 [Gemmatimonadetes bacterium]|nr:isp 2 [Gemmatimonadota bacterium]
MGDTPEGQPPAQKPLAEPAAVQKARDEVVAEDAKAMKADRLARHEDIRVNMLRSFVSEPLLSAVRDAVNDGRSDASFDIIISLNEFYRDGMARAQQLVEERAKQLKVRYALASHYVFGCLTADQILGLAAEARALVEEGGPNNSVVYRIWEDTEISVTLTRSASTVKVDAAQRAFRADGRNIVWAVLDSGIDGTHPHFKCDKSPFGAIDSLALTSPLAHCDFTPANTGATPESATATTDAFGHGTHVAGIIAGHWESPDGSAKPVVGTETRDEATNKAVPRLDSIDMISGMAPRCRLVSMKVIADTTQQNPKQTAGQGKVSWVLMAIDKIQAWNQSGRRLLVHGVNMSLGYDFDPRWFACGQSPICVEVNRLVKCGVSVVVSAGNAGYSALVTASGAAEAHYNDLTITDPGNAEMAITVGSTHRDMPHLYGVSYFSSRGPTGDGRMKPDLVAPGERIISCAAGAEKAKYTGVGAPSPEGTPTEVLYCEQTGTSMAAPHVSGAIAAFLSVRNEFIGQPERVKELVVGNTIDLKRDRAFQGSGLLDIMKVLQAV